MNKKALLVLITLFSMLSLLALPAFALPTSTYEVFEATGCAYVKTCEGCYSGQAVLVAEVETSTILGTGASSAVSEISTGGYVYILVCDHLFVWVINPCTIKETCNFLTFEACPTTAVAGTALVTPSSGVGIPSTPLSPICVAIDLCKPYCVTAVGLTEAFVGQLSVTAPG